MENFNTKEFVIEDNDFLIRNGVLTKKRMAWNYCWYPKSFEERDYNYSKYWYIHPVR